MGVYSWTIKIKLVGSWKTNGAVCSACETQPYSKPLSRPELEIDFNPTGPLGTCARNSRHTMCTLHTDHTSCSI